MRYGTLVSSDPLAPPGGSLMTVIGTKFGVPIEGWHTESGPGVYEAALQYGEVKEMADKAGLFKYVPRMKHCFCGVLMELQVRGKMSREQIWHYALLYGKTKRRPSRKLRSFAW